MTDRDCRITLGHSLTEYVLTRVLILHGRPSPILMTTCLALGHFADRRFPPLRIKVNSAGCETNTQPLTIWSGNTLFLDYCGRTLGFFICISAKT